MKKQDANLIGGKGGNKHACSKSVAFPEEYLKFDFFASYLQQIDAEENGFKKQYLQALIQHFLELSREQQVINIADANVQEMFRLTDQTLSLSFDQKKSSFNLFTTPSFSELIYYKEGSTAFPGKLEDCANFITEFRRYLSDQKDLRAALCYKAIWNQYSALPCLLVPEIILPYKSCLTGQQTYQLLNPDFSFISVDTILGAEQVRTTIEDIDAISLSPEEIFQRLAVELPLVHFIFHGFGRIEVSDVTVTHLTRLIARKVVATDEFNHGFTYLEDVLQALGVVAGESNLEFGLLPMFQLNGEFVFSEIFYNKPSEELDRITRQDLFDYLANVYRLKPYRIYLNEIENEVAEKFEYLKIQRSRGVKSFALLPVYYHDLFVGVLEVCHTGSGRLSKSVLTKLETFFPVLSIIFKKSIDRLNQTVQEVIKTKFTSLQPSVQWRFNQAAWRFIQNISVENGTAEIEDIGFEHVYPLYGAIDVKDSTIKRNQALRDDALAHLDLLINKLAEIGRLTTFALLDEKVSACKRWQEQINDDAWVFQEGELTYFFETDIDSFLTELAAGNPDILSIVENYRSLKNEENGLISVKSRMLEVSMNAVINTVNSLVDQIQQQSQNDYPCFFEKFRTDGVEYDIYIGQSIAPGQAFRNIYIQNLRLLQLTNMIEIYRQVNLLQAAIPVPIEVTQLIFVNPNYIDIRFRRDERRFDVEGAYNIRYHIVKKRIDKVLIKNTSERLTAPGKIAVVYFNQKEADEYLVHIRYLQNRSLLTEEIELLDLEQLQGVIGLKAIRITMNLAEQKNRIQN